MEHHIKRTNRKKIIICLICILILFTFSACIVLESKAKSYSKVNEIVASNSENDGSKRKTAKKTNQADQEQKEIEKTQYAVFFPEDAYSYCDDVSCKYDNDKLHFSFDFTKGIPISDDEKVYLFKLDDCETDNDLNIKSPIAEVKKEKKIDFSLTFRKELLFSNFVPAVLHRGQYVALSDGKYISNPECVAKNTREYPNIKSKKGLLLDGETLGTDKLTKLNVRRVVYNIPLSIITGETDDEEYPTIEYEYKGKKYKYNGHVCMIYDSLFSYLTEHGYHSTAIVLNDWNTDYPEIIHPLSRRKTGRSLYYAFNTEEKEGLELIEATAMFLAERYSGGEHGMVYDWVIANEINQNRIWNYMDSEDVDYYSKSFEKSFRIFYNAIKASYGQARIYFSIDHDWNDNLGNNRRFFNGRDLLYSFNKYANIGGNYDWGISIHPYPQPLTKVRFWIGEYDKSEEARILTPMNLSTITDLMKKSDFLDTNGNVRDIAVTEIGFSSKAGERLQAAAFAYSYYIIDHNPYISSYLLNRQTDDNEALKSGLALGIYNNDYSSKYIAEVFSYIDTNKGEEYISEMLEIIGAKSLEEALSWAE